VGMRSCMIGIAVPAIVLEVGSRIGGWAPTRSWRKTIPPRVSSSQLPLALTWHCRSVDGRAEVTAFRLVLAADRDRG
ncbi:MAG TPA: hypothetical protein VGG90_12910, partial [Candidatus Dormibacteraeota bacterium]